MASSKAGRPIRCFTRALKNARYLQQQDPVRFDRDKSAEGFGTGVPMEILIGLHRLRAESPDLQAHPDLVEFLKTHAIPGPQRWQP
jgi:hypothetical protein